MDRRPVARRGRPRHRDAGARGIRRGTRRDADRRRRFSITIDGYEVASFGELVVVESGIEASGLVLDDRGIAVPRKRQPPTVVLKRGMSRSLEIAAWDELAMSDAAEARKSASIVFYDVEGKPVARYHLENAWPSKVEIGTLAAGDASVLTETVTIVCERILRVSA